MTETVEEYLARGRKITTVPMGVTKIDLSTGMPAKKVKSFRKSSKRGAKAQKTFSRNKSTLT